MDYECQIVPAEKLMVSEHGIAKPLCDDCQTPDCTNPIRQITVSRCGIPVKSRLWMVNGIYRAVVACKGYIGAQQLKPDEDTTL